MTNEEKELKRLYLKLWREKNKDKVKLQPLCSYTNRFIKKDKM